MFRLLVLLVALATATLLTGPAAASADMGQGCPSQTRLEVCEAPVVSARGAATLGHFELVSSAAVDHAASDKLLDPSREGRAALGFDRMVWPATQGLGGPWRPPCA